MNLVSIIVPVYNRSKTIDLCYRSLINQTYSNIEIIFVNDGSTDNSLEIIKKFNDKRIVVINQNNCGPSEARRKGFNKSKGRYICFVDSDDTIDRDYIEKLVIAIERDNSNMAIGRIGVHYYYPVVRYATLKVRRRPRIIDLEEDKKYLSLLTPGIIGKLFKREFIMLCELDFKANEDIAVMYPMYIKCRYISVVNNTVYHYHLAETSQFKEYLLGYKFDNLMNTFGPLKYIYDEIDKMGKLGDYYYEVEMLFIKNISERIWNIMESVPDRIYRYKFISVILDYLEYFFPNWEKNPYYVKGYMLGEVSDIYHIRVAHSEIKKIGRKRLFISLGKIYERYQNVEEMYNKIKKDYISRI